MDQSEYFGGDRLVQCAMNYLLYYTQLTKTTSIRTQLGALPVCCMNIFNTNAKSINKITEKWKSKYMYHH